MQYQQQLQLKRSEFIELGSDDDGNHGDGPYDGDGTDYPYDGDEITN